MEINKCKCGAFPELESYDKSYDIVKTLYRFVCSCGKSTVWYRSAEQALSAWNKENPTVSSIFGQVASNLGSLGIAPSKFTHTTNIDVTDRISKCCGAPQYLQYNENLGVYEIMCKICGNLSRGKCYGQTIYDWNNLIQKQVIASALSILSPAMTGDDHTKKMTGTGSMLQVTCQEKEQQKLLLLEDV